MSLILQGVDLPKDGETITIDVCSCGIAWVSNKGEWDKHQAIQIPKGHGRIADVGEGEKKMCGECQFKDSDCLKDPSVFCTDREIFSLAPTILEAEGEEDEQPRG